MAAQRAGPFGKQGMTVRVGFDRPEAVRSRIALPRWSCARKEICSSLTHWRFFAAGFRLPHGARSARYIARRGRADHCPDVVLTVGEPPGDHEGLMDCPLAGPVGQLSRGTMADVGLDRAWVWMTNAVKKPQVQPSRQTLPTPEIDLGRDPGLPLVARAGVGLRPGR